MPFQASQFPLSPTSSSAKKANRKLQLSFSLSYFRSEFFLSSTHNEDVAGIEFYPIRQPSNRGGMQAKIC